MARLRALLVALLAIVLLAALVAPADALFKRKKKKVAGGAKVTKLEPLLKKAKLLSSKNVNVLKKEFLSTKKWKKLQSFGSSVDVRVYSAKPMNVKSPVIVIKEFVLPTAKMGSKDWKKAHDMFEDARNEIAVGSKLNGLPFIARYLGNDAAPEPQENGNKKFRAALFMNKADASMDSLFDAGQPASTDQATRKLIAQMFIAVGVMHWKGYIHRDLKPAQFLIVNGANGERTVRLADFGTAIKNDPKVIWQDTLNQIGTTIADKKTAEIATPGTKAGLPVFENQAYRSPESMKFFEIQDLRQNLVDYYGKATSRAGGAQDQEGAQGS
ncbi:hypothetical protein DFJ74DRAFT_334664 [Hyaloraphidium curvatum]|nr:hypothetical protein DFJ74DRAFT_334664 [Hyaloraphidium curvatum]